MNTTIIHDARLVDNPEELTLGGNEVIKLRLADNPISKERNITRYVDALCGGRLSAVAKKLAKGDTISIVGNLVLREYKASGKGKVKKGTVMRTDEMPFVQEIRVQRSDTFFGSTEATGDADEEAEATEAPPAVGKKDDDLPF